MSDHAREEIGRAIERLAVRPSGEAARTPVLVLTDMFGGTPANLGVTFVSDDVEVITGVNLPMLIKLARPHTGDEPADDRARDARGRPQRDLGGLRPAARREGETER